MIPKFKIINKKSGFVYAVNDSLYFVIAGEKLYKRRMQCYNNAVRAVYSDVTDKYHVCMGTGLLDKNGKEIFEGDRFKCGDLIGVIKQKEGRWICDWEKRPCFYTEKLFPHIGDGEVIGNIHDKEEPK